jgi:hypothetical protein
MADYVIAPDNYGIGVTAVADADRRLLDGGRFLRAYLARLAGLLRRLH